MHIAKLVLVVIFATGSAFSQADSADRLGITVRAANFDGSPVRIVSVKRTPDLPYADVVVKNESGRTVTGLRFYLLFPGTKGCTYEGDYGYADSNSDTLESLVPHEPTLALRPVKLGPNQQSSTITKLLSSYSLVGILRETREPYVPVLLAVEMVRFDDGSLWERTPPPTTEAAGYFQKDKETCRLFAHTAPVPADYATTSRQSPENAGEYRDLDANSGFAFTCSLKDRVLNCPLK